MSKELTPREIKLAEISAFFNAQWKEDIEKMDAEEQEFMKTIHDLLFIMHQAFENADSNADNPLATPYEFPGVLAKVSKLMDLYVCMFHIVSCTASWQENCTPKS